MARRDSKIKPRPRPALTKKSLTFLFVHFTSNFLHQVPTAMLVMACLYGLLLMVWTAFTPKHRKVADTINMMDDTLLSSSTTETPRFREILNSVGLSATINVRKSGGGFTNVSHFNFTLLNSSTRILN